MLGLKLVNLFLFNVVNNNKSLGKIILHFATIHSIHISSGFFYFYFLVFLAFCFCIYRHLYFINVLLALCFSILQLLLYLKGKSFNLYSLN